MRKKSITRSSGFTLLELLISVTLIAVLVLILSMAVRTGLRAYSRGKKINKRLIVVSSIEGLLGRQLRAVVAHVPLGSQAGGLFRVVYRFDEKRKKLIYAQKVITRPEDLKEPLPDNIDQEDKEDLTEQGWGVSIINGIDSLAFTYQSQLPDESDVFYTSPFILVSAK